MIEFVDEIRTNPTRIQLAAVSGQENTYDYTKIGEVSQDGTNINRAALMAIQGFIAQTIAFDSTTNTITKTNALGQVLTIKYNDDGSITETLVGEKTITKKIMLSGNGQIKVVIS